jgi:hypothetical protein
MAIEVANRRDMGLLAGAVCLILLGGGCASYRTLDVKVPVPPNPTEGKAVVIVRVTDRREFAPARKLATDTTSPSQDVFRKGDAGNTNITARAIAFGTYLLPEGRTVEDLVGDILTTSFREAGYRVVDRGSAVRENAIPVEADIEYFWCGWKAEVVAYALMFGARVKVSADLPGLRRGEPMDARLTLHTANARAAGNWLKTINKGIEAFVKEMKLRLGGRPPS